MSITPLERSGGAVLGFAVSGDVSKADYEVLTPAVAAAVDQHGTVRLLLDLTDFEWEKISAWGDDVHLGREYHDTIERMAIVGDHRWERLLVDIAGPFYAQEAKHFTSDDEAWRWLES